MFIGKIYCDLKGETLRRVKKLFEKDSSRFLNEHGNPGDGYYEIIQDCFRRAERVVSCKYGLSRRLDSEQHYWWDEYYTDVIESCREWIIDHPENDPRSFDVQVSTEINTVLKMNIPISGKGNRHAQIEDYVERHRDEIIELAKANLFRNFDSDWRENVYIKVL